MEVIAVHASASTLEAPSIPHAGVGGGRRVLRSRIEQAYRRLKAVEDLQAHPQEDSELAARGRSAAAVAPWADRSSILQGRKLFAEEGFEGLIDLRTGRPSTLPEKAREAIITLRRGDPDYPVPDTVALLLLHHNFKTGESSV